MRVSRAFSLIELLLVVAIMGIVAAMAAPRYGEALSRYRVDAAARRIAADLALAQAEARANSAARTITFHADKGVYQLNGVTGLNGGTSSYTVDLTADPYFAGITTVNFGGNATVSFNGYGVPNSSGSIQLRRGSTTRNVILDADAGATSLQ